MINRKSSLNKKLLINLTNFAINVINEINNLRTDPLEYAKKIVTSAAFVAEDVLLYKDNTFKLSEKKFSFIDAIKFLEVQERRPKMKMKIGVLKSSEELMKVMILHDGIENTNEFPNCDLEKRMNKYGCAFGELDELIDFGNITPECVVLNFLLCDGDLERKERNILFKDNLNYIGVYSEILPSEKICTIINMAQHYYDVGEDVPDSLLKFYYPQVFKRLEKEKLRKSNGSQLQRIQYQTAYSPSINLNNSHHNNHSIPTPNKEKIVISNHLNNLNKSVNQNTIINTDDSFRKMKDIEKIPRKNIYIQEFDKDYAQDNEQERFSNNNSFQFSNENSKNY